MGREEWSWGEVGRGGRKMKRDESTEQMRGGSVTEEPWHTIAKSHCFSLTAVTQRCSPYTVTTNHCVCVCVCLWIFSGITMCLISKHNLKCRIIGPQHTFPLCFTSSQMSLGPEKSATSLDVVNIWLSLCMMVLTFRQQWCSDERCLLTTVSWSDPKPM